MIKRKTRLMAGFELFEGGEGCIQHHEETIYAT